MDKIHFNNSKINDNNNYIFYSIESEQSVIGGLLIDNTKINDVIEIVSNNDFFLDNHKIIFEEIEKLFNLNKPIDLITISESLNNKNKLNIIGGNIYLLKLVKNVPSVSNILYYSEIIKEKSIIRKLISFSNNIYNLCVNPKGKKLNDIIDYIESNLFKLINKQINSNNPKNISLFLNNILNNIINNNKNIDNLTGLSSGFYDLDKKTLGFQNSDLIIIAARPSMGKTTFALNICENISLLNKKPILIFSLEMSFNQIIIKILSSLSKIDQYKIKTGNLSQKDIQTINNTINILIYNKNIYIDDSSNITTFEIRSKSRKIFKENNGLSLIVIDYLQLIKVPYILNNRTMEITEISRSLKSLAKELDIPIIAISQLNRSLELRSDKRPINSDLRESGSIEQDADLIIFIYRDELYNINNNTGITEIILGKHRNGPLGSIKLLFNNKCSKFENYINVKNVK